MAALAIATPASADEVFRRLVEFGPMADDGPTNRLKAALVAGFQDAEGFEIGVGRKPGTVLISFEKPVEARAHLGRTEYLYRVELRAVNGRLFERGFGSCWSDELKVCVFNVIKLAARVAPRL